MPSAAVIVIGEEILSGKFRDENGPYAVERMRALGADLRRIVVIGDEPDVIAAEVRACADRYDVVVTSGGVGPTHDDVTLESVALAFGEPLELRDELVALLRRFDLPENDATLRMATVPRGTELIADEAVAYPIVRVRNVFVLPGVPALFRTKLESLAPFLRGELVHTGRVYTDERETEIAARLRAVAERHANVSIGSYPRWGEGDFRVIITAESRDGAALDRVLDELCAVLSVVRRA